MSAKSQRRLQYVVNILCAICDAPKSLVPIGSTGVLFGTCVRCLVSHGVDR